MKPTTVRKLSAKAATLIVAVLTTSLSATAMAETNEPHYTMTVYSDTQLGQKVIEGDYEAAIGKASSLLGAKRPSFTSMTSLCVAFAKSGDLDQAAQTCDAAIARLESQEQNLIRRASSRREGKAAYSRYMAVALANRGVLHAAMGESQLARNYFEQAVNLQTGIEGASTNLARLEKD